MVEVSRLLSEVPIFGLVACLVAVLSRDPAEKGAVPEPAPAPEPEPEPAPEPEPEPAPVGAAPEGPRPPGEGAACAGPPLRPRSLAAPDAAVRALLTLAPFVMALVRRCGVPERDVPDVTQEVWIGVLPWWACRTAAELAAPGHLRGYARAVAVHRAIGYRRRLARRKEHLGWEPGHDAGHDPSPEAAPEEAPCPEDLLLEMEAGRERAAETDLDRLSTATGAAPWRAFYAHEVLGVPVKDIAEAERVSAATIYTRLRTARRDLRAAILRYRAATRTR